MAPEPIGPRENGQLKVYVLSWSNPCTGVTDRDGTTHCFPHKRVVVARSESEALVIFYTKELQSRAEMRGQLVGTKPDADIDKLISDVFTRESFCVREFSLQEGLIV